MKFSGVMVDASVISQFISIVQSLDKISKEVTIRITSEKFYFIVTNYECAPKPVVWVAIDHDYLFNDFSMAGVSKENNEIYLTIQIGNLAGYLSHSHENARLISLKLTNKLTPCLTVEIEWTKSGDDFVHQPMHDIPVAVVRRKYWSDYPEPKDRKYDVVFEMPKMKLLNSCVDKMGKFDLVTVCAGKGELVLRLNEQHFSSELRFPDAKVDLAEKRDETYSICVKVKAFKRTISLPNSIMCRVKCGLVQNEILAIFCEPASNPVSFQCFLGATFD